jgi:hypothetical protein
MLGNNMGNLLVSWQEHHGNIMGTHQEQAKTILSPLLKKKKIIGSLMSASLPLLIGCMKL